MQENTIKYWNTIKRGIYACPNPVLYRLINSVNITIDNKYILDLGCGKGQDLFEILRRGGKPYGIDIDVRAIQRINNFKKSNLYPIVHHGSIFDNTDIFNQSFDIIISQDTLYYLEDKNCNRCLDNVYKILKPDGIFVIKVITGDYSVINDKLVFDPKAICKTSENPIIYRNRDYYISLLNDKNFNIIAEKIVMESFLLHCESMRYMLYLVAKKNPIKNEK
ncbi:Methyltransferase type 11 domain protein [Candidatus Magnetomorum sp. HK-1]|nr:Methyltransferase type 11 domain protein [Candidatus Magnetomorum sp. HK-1]